MTDFIFVEGILISDEGEEFEVPFSFPCWIWEVNRHRELCGLRRQTPQHLLNQQMINLLSSSVLSEIRDWGKTLIKSDEEIREEAREALRREEIKSRRYYSPASYVGESLSDEGRQVDREGCWITEYSLLGCPRSSIEACNQFRDEVIKDLEEGIVPVEDFYPTIWRGWKR